MEKIINTLTTDFDLTEQTKLEETYINKISENINLKLEEYVRTYTQPPIKGEITKGKIKWRGITLGVRNNFLKNIEYFVMQRGKIISPTIKIENISI